MRRLAPGYSIIFRRIPLIGHEHGEQRRSADSGQDGQPEAYREIRDAIETSSIRLIPPTERHAEIAADARLRYPLNLGHCFAYALAKDEDRALLTLDRDFRRSDAKVILPRAQ